MGFLAVTITDLSDNVKEMTYGSIKSFLKYHKNKLIVYIIGDKEFTLKSDQIEIIRLPEKDYNLAQNVENEYFQKIMNILIEKTLIFSKHTNFLFFENDVFFFDSMQSVWGNLEDGVSGHRCTYGKLSRVKTESVNTGLVFVKNYKFNFTLKDIENFFKNKKSHWPDEEFLANQLEQKDIHFLTQKDTIVCGVTANYYEKPVFDTKSIHVTGFPKPPFKTLKNTNRILVPLFRRINEIFY